MEYIFETFLFIGRMYDKLNIIDFTFAITLIILTIVSILFLYSFYKEPMIDLEERKNRIGRGEQ